MYFMKKFKFEKPFTSFEQSFQYSMIPIKDQWRIAFHDPAYLIIFSGMLIITIFGIMSTM